MNDNIVVFFDRDTGDYLDVRERTETFIRGWVINGHWDIYIDLVTKEVYHDRSRDVEGVRLREFISTFKTIDIVPAPSDGDYNEVIDNARRLLASRVPR